MTITGRSNFEWLYYTTGTNVSKAESYTFNLTGSHTFISQATNGAGTSYSTPITVNVTGADVLQDFACTNFTVSGPCANGNGNALSANWSTDNTSTITYTVNWTHPASVTNAVMVVGPIGGGIYITSGTSYTATHPSVGSGPKYVLVYRTGATPVDNVTITVSNSGAGIVRSVYGKGLNTCADYTSLPVNVTVNGITGYYHYNRRDCTNEIDNNSGNNLNSGTETRSSIPATSGNTIGMVEFVNHNASFTPIVQSPTEFETWLLFVRANYAGIATVKYLTPNWAVWTYTQSGIPPYTEVYSGYCAGGIVEILAGDARLDYTCG